MNGKEQDEERATAEQVATVVEQLQDAGFEVVTPQFTRPAGWTSPAAPPADDEAWRALGRADATALKELGLAPWGAEEDEDGAEGWEVVCPDGRVRHNPYHNLGDAESHARHASDPRWFANRGCRLAPKPGRLERSLPPCPGGTHEVHPDGRFLWLFPGEWYSAIPADLPIVDIFFRDERFIPGVTDDDIRFGYLSFGVLGPRP